jgi:hypothetical protein
MVSDFASGGEDSALLERPPLRPAWLFSPDRGTSGADREDQSAKRWVARFQGQPTIRQFGGTMAKPSDDRCIGQIDLRNRSGPQYEGRIVHRFPREKKDKSSDDGNSRLKILPVRRAARPASYERCL